MHHDYVIKNNKFILTPVTEADIELMRGWRNSPLNHSSFLTNNYIDMDQQKRWFENYLQKTNDIMFIVKDLEDSGKRVGMLGLYDIDNDKNKKKAEFGRLLIGEPSTRGKGLGLAVTLNLCKFGFQILELDEIYLEVITDNVTAHKIYKKAGFLETERYSINGKEIIKMSLFKENF
ncbi:GNAT family N-acetyltransferase [Paenibacillus taichungensis]|uniref:GNAT family N-acetyltransferase n=1 Tax=Paenibacillus taichungensis TaxID=484184 RepID=A0A329QEK1_9BACL|nr:GNAT family protein [Paenibacillus taichungensis]RAW10903.1 GNAT family N-acetyltransferase [Paenibacillus taichungensis]